MKQSILALGAAGLALALVQPSAPATPAPQGPDLDIPNDFQAGTPARASEVNDNFQAVQAHSNGLSDAIDDISVDLGDLESGLSELAARIASSENLVTVSPQGGSFSSISNALVFAGDTAAQLSERVVVLVLPGTYEEAATVTVPSDVTLLGTNRTSTLLRVEASPAVELEDRAQLSCISVQNTLDAEALIGIRASNTVSDTLIEDVRVLPPDPATFITGIGAYSSVLTIRRTEVLEEGVFGIGIQVGGSADVTSNVSIEDSEVCVRPFGLDAFLDCEVFVRRSLIRAPTPIFAHFDRTVVKVEGSELTSTDDSSVVNASQNALVLMATSQLAGDDPVVSTGGAARTVHCYSDDFNAIANGDA